ncbi:uncharacterized protein LOC107493514 [Arachis duranensis]|uniref:Uncharacterized protein LOC107493514 n=1 Tax=Arachis duranensis TaxID=130453 RepID=A0A6P4DVY9_ARADU|nr:uncharacterized protein LOC107493514 [Arachis duranensis]
MEEEGKVNDDEDKGNERVSLNEQMGLRGDEKLRMVKDLKNNYRLNMLGLVETKRQLVTRFDVLKIWDNGCAGREYVGSDVASGGLLLMWDEGFFKMRNCYKGDRRLNVEGDLSENSINCTFFLVYGAHARDEKLVLWEKLGVFAAPYLTRSVAAAMCEDNGCGYVERDGVEETMLWVLSMTKKTILWPVGAVSTLQACSQEFKDWINDIGLVDLPITDRKFTWFRGRSCSRIDRVLVSLKWLESFAETRLRGGPRGLSDHCPIIVEDKRIRDGPRPFRCLDLWFTHEGFLRMVKEEWRGLGAIQFTDKLKALTGPLGRWHRDNFGDMDKKITKFEEEIKKIDDMVGNGTYD